MGQVDRRRGLGRAADSHQDDVGAFQIAGALAVVVGHGEVERVHPLEVAGVQGVLGAHTGGERGPEIAGQGRDQRIQGGNAGHLHIATALLQRRAQLLVDDGVQHHPRSALDLLQHPVQLPA